MKKIITIVTVISVLVLPTYSALAGMGVERMNSDFNKMDKMIGKAEKSTNRKQRQQYMKDHMKMMMKQMGSMDNMMAGDKSKKRDMPDSGDMDKRMDMMQMMMEHMMRQQNMMMKNMQ